MDQCKHDHNATCCKAYSWCSECEQCGGTVPMHDHSYEWSLLPSACTDEPLRLAQESLFSLHSTVYGAYDETGGYIFEHFRYFGPFMLKQHRYADATCRTAHDFYQKCLHETDMTHEDISAANADFHSIGRCYRRC